MKKSSIEEKLEQVPCMDYEILLSLISCEIERFKKDEDGEDLSPDVLRDLVEVAMADVESVFGLEFSLYGLFEAGEVDFLAEEAVAS